MAANRREIEEQSRSLVAGQMLPGGVLIGLGAVFVLGMVLVLVGLLMPESITGSLGWALALLGLGGAGVAGLGKLLLERSAAARLEACQMQMRMLQGQIEQARQQRDESDRQLQAAGVVLSPASLQARLQTAQQELAALEAAVPLQSRLAAASQEAEAASQRAAEAREQYARARRQWRESLAGANLPERLSPRGVRRWLRRAEQIEPFYRRLSLRREDLHQRTQEFEALADRIRGTAEQVGSGHEAATPEEKLACLVEALQTERSLAARRRELRRRNRQLARRQSRTAEVVRRLKGLRRSLLRRVGVRSEQQLRELAVRAARVELLRKERSELDQAMAQAIGRPEDRAAVYRLLEEETPAEQLAAQREQLRRELERLETQRTRRYEQRGRVSEQMRTLAADRTLARKQLELSRLEQRMAQSARRWQMLAVCCRIFDELKHNYQKHRQPETLLEASDYLTRLTEGRYVRVWTPLDQDILLVDTPDGDSLPVEALSRGTREQLFLGLRLALAACYARRGMALTLVLDDVLVNFDAVRAKAAAGVLRDFAKAGHQVLLFTCHDHLMKLFKSLKAPIAQLPDCSQVPAGSVSFTSAARSSRRRTSQRGSGRENVSSAQRGDAADSSGETAEQEPDAQGEPHIRALSAGDSLAWLPEPPPVPESRSDESPDELRADCPSRNERVA